MADRRRDRPLHACPGSDPRPLHHGRGSDWRSCSSCARRSARRAPIVWGSSPVSTPSTMCTPSSLKSWPCNEIVPSKTMANAPTGVWQPAWRRRRKLRSVSTARREGRLTPATRTRHARSYASIERGRANSRREVIATFRGTSTTATLSSSRGLGKGVCDLECVLRPPHPTLSASGGEGS